MIDVYRRPIPQLAPAGRSRPHAHAMMDVSDGLLIDAERMAQASGCAARTSTSTPSPCPDAFLEDRGGGLDGAFVRGDRGRRLCVAGRAGRRVRPVNSFLYRKGPTSVSCIGSLAAGARVGRGD